MKIIQQDFKIISPIWFILFLIFSIGLTYGFSLNKYNNLLHLIFGMVGIVIIIICIIGTYQVSFIYYFKSTEIIALPLFGLFGRRVYSFKDLKKVEYAISPSDHIEAIYLYFEKNKIKGKISLSMLQIDMGKVKLFLHTHVENLEEIAEEKYR